MPVCRDSLTFLPCYVPRLEVFFWSLQFQLCLPNGIQLSVGDTCPSQQHWPSAYNSLLSRLQKLEPTVWALFQATPPLPPHPEAALRLRTVWHELRFNVDKIKGGSGWFDVERLAHYEHPLHVDPQPWG
ncbi:hypothetical protein CYMTET_48592 [Cymbomonas tetramitiformis]|uniref:Uncharacterized protein n=1 Tax=Cymbomonas tetramitiformis TaxID=36881 RepID=A0AAE0EWM3_9CHLO|nr:hypothetical protein CYMTET_48592 [Cymbomonas tetramitiformis]|eukprot:gene9794-11602_t